MNLSCNDYDNISPMQSEIQSSSKPRILIIKPSSFGDIILTLPALRQLRLQYPGAYIAWMVNQSLSELLEGNPLLDEVIPFDRKTYGKVANLGKLLGFMRQLRQKYFDIVLDFQGLLRSGLISRFSGVAYRVGFSHAREGSAHCYNCQIQLPKNIPHVSDQYIYLVSTFHKIYTGKTLCPIPFPEHETPRWFPIPESTKQKIKNELHSAGWSDNQKLILIHPGARWESKRWMPEKFTALIQSINEHKDYFPVIIGGPEDIPIGQQIIATLSQSPLNWIAKTNLKELIVLIEMSDVLVSHDSGPMHLAGAIGTPVIAIFGPSDPIYSGPHNPKDIVIRTGVSCSPCFKTVCPGLGNVCLTDITPQQVIQALETVLG